MLKTVMKCGGNEIGRPFPILQASQRRKLCKCQSESPKNCFNLFRTMVACGYGPIRIRTRKDVTGEY